VANHTLDRRGHFGRRVTTTVNLHCKRSVVEIVERHTLFLFSEFILRGMTDGQLWARTKEQQAFLDLSTLGYLEEANKKLYASCIIEEWLTWWPESELMFEKPLPDDRPLTDKQKHHRSQAVGQAVEKRREACLLPH